MELVIPILVTIFILTIDVLFIIFYILHTPKNLRGYYCIPSFAILILVSILGLIGAWC